MAKNKFSFAIIAPKSFIKLLGAEYDLLQNAGNNILNRFYIAALLIVLIMITTFMSIHYAIDLIFNVQIVEIVLSVFLSFLFGLIYILLINTFTKEKKGLKNEILNLSNITRIVFVIFMGFIISKPIEIFFFGNFIEQYVEENKIELLHDHSEKINSLYQKDLLKLEKRKSDLLASFLQDEANKVSIRIDSIKKEEIELIAVARNKIGLSNFFIFRVKTVVKKYPLSWLVCGFIIILFLLPGFLIYSISADALYFKLKKAHEKEIIGKEYTAFSKRYSLLFMDNYKLNLEFYTKFSDPPFNTKPIEDIKYKASKDFHSRFSTE